MKDITAMANAYFESLQSVPTAATPDLTEWIKQSIIKAFEAGYQAHQVH